MEVAFLLNKEEEWESKILITINLEMKNTWFHQHHGLKMQRTTRIISIEGKIQSPTLHVQLVPPNKTYKLITKATILHLGSP